MPKSNIQTFRLNSLTGGINSISEVNDLASFDYGGTGVQAEAADIENFMPLNRGGQTSTYGYTLYKAVGTFITGLYNFRQSNGNSYFMCSYGTNVSKLVAGTLTSIATITSGALTHFETAQDKLVICDGTLAPQTWDGATTATLGNGIPTGARQTLYYQNRLWVFSVTNNRSYLYYSNADDITTGYSSQFVQCDYLDGQNITGIAKYFIPGSLEPVILVAKDQSIGIITGDGSTGYPYTFSKVNFDFGMPAFRGFVQFGQRIAYITPQGVGSFDTGPGAASVAYTQAKLPYQYLSEKVRNQFQNLPQATLSNAIAFHDWLQTRITYAVTESNNTYNNVLWHFDYRLGCWYKTRPAHKITAAYVDNITGVLYTGDDSGNIYNWGSSYTDFNGKTISAYYKTPFLDFGVTHRRKRIISASILSQSNIPLNLAISNSIDYGDRSSITNNVKLASTKYTWGGGVWTNNAGTYQWGASTVQIRRFIPSGFFRNIQFNISSVTTGAVLNFFELVFEVEFEASY